jgi:dTDP-6-deoxy-L-talose 4-dehydrogenase (NAD+)
LSTPATLPKIAITGASGFIGRHVVADLIRRGVTPTLLLRPSSALPPNAEHCSVVRYELAEPGDTAYAAAGQPEVLIHLAWGGLPHFRSLHHFEHETPLHYCWLKGMARAGLKHLVAAGTCAEYGMQSGALAEEMAPQPIHAYGFAKDILRRELEYLQSEQAFGLTWARLFYLYGEGQAANSLWPLLQAAAARSDAEFPMSGGEQLRDYLPVVDAARCLVDLAVSHAILRRGIGTVNICSGEPISIRTLAENWIADHGWPIRLRLGHLPYPDYEPMAFWGDAGKLRRFLNQSLETQ